MKRPDSHLSSMSVRSVASRYSRADFTGEGSRLLCNFCTNTAVKACLTCKKSYCVTCSLENSGTDREIHQLQDLQDQILWEQHHKQLPSPPGQIQFLSVQPQSVTLRWSPPEGPVPHMFRVNRIWGKVKCSIVVKSYQVEETGLLPGEKYHFTVVTLSEDDHQSPCVEGSVYTEPMMPENLTVESNSSCASLKWTKPEGIDQVSYWLELSFEGKRLRSIDTDILLYSISDLQPGNKYTVQVSTMKNDRKSKPISKSFTTEPPLPKLLSTLGLRDLHGGNLTLSSVLEISSNMVSDKPAQSLEQLPWTFLRKLMMSNLNARNIKCAQNQSMYNNSFTDPNDDSDAIHPLDLITALFHCSDPFLQQEMVSKMSMCQFAVPLLLPNCDTQQSTLMLWAMRGLVKKFKPHSLAREKTFIEGRIVEMDIPMVSFVRLGESSLPKSQTLNKLLSNLHHHSDTFVHRDMECVDVPRRISDGLVEVSWYLPCGNNTIDIFKEPVAIANLRGDGRLFKTQMSFLCETSAAVFIFCDDLEGDLSTLNNRESRAELFLVTNSQSKTFNMETLRDICMKHKVKDKNVIIKKKQDNAKFLRALRFLVSKAIANNPIKKNGVITSKKVEDMAAVAQQVGIVVDEDCTECKNGKAHAEDITGSIQNDVKFKEDEDEAIKSLLKTKEQQQKAVSEAMGKFTVGISQSGTQRLYFLKWLKIQLDNLSRHNLSTLRRQYKDCCTNTPQNEKRIADLDEQISNCSLGPEHFFRELGQIYESACSLPEENPARQQVQNLPALCAQMLLDGFPVELVDGDSSNIPMKWKQEVLTQLHQLVDTNSKILVLTVLGVQSTGKSTLLNTMFGVQFAVSSGRCIRGAFMLLIKVSEELRSELKCDFIMVIDTNGFKSPELENDNELATLVMGLSDITIINIARENSTAMKDILQIVVHAFPKMNKVGKKPRCLFVHQNVSDISAYDSNLINRKKLVEQLDEMTRATAKIAGAKFTEVMKYDPDKDSYYIPGLWHGTPPMAPVNAGYSQEVYEIKKSLIDSLNTSDNNATEFLRLIEDLWNAVKCL